MNQKNPDTSNTPSSIDKLNWTVQPSRNLWPYIQQNLASPTQSLSKRAFGWHSYALAASFVLAITAIILSYHSYNETQGLLQHQAQLIEQQQQRIAVLQAQHQDTRQKMIALLQSEPRIPDAGLLATAQAAMDAIDLASAEIYSVINPSTLNPHLYNTLEKTYEQEQQLYQQLLYYQHYSTQHTF